MDKGRPEQHRALALTYGKHSHTPQVVAKGYGDLARQIVAQAQAVGVPVHSSPELVGLLMQVDLDERVPPVLYQAVAELLVWLSRADEEAPLG